MTNQIKFLIFFVILALGLTFLSLLFSPANPADHNYYTVDIPIGTPSNQIGQILVKSGLVKEYGIFRWSSYLIGFDNKYKAGTYQFSPSRSLISILYTLIRGAATGNLVTVTFPEGYSIYRMGEMLKIKEIKAGENFTSLAKSFPDVFCQKYPFLKNNPTDSLEGYLFPDTYFIPKEASAVTIADIMLENFSKKVLPIWDETKLSKYSLHEILTLASIVEKEAAVDSERTVIASVFYNRLKNGMMLKADPTVKYALERPGRTVTYSDLKVNSPYNTYTHYGLPPGPIASPGLASIKAALVPANTPYLYFVAKGDGTHFFSVNWQDHLAAQKRYFR